MPKTRTDKLCFVQFIHPGGEHGRSHRDWNCGKHKRKFLQCAGRRYGRDQSEPVHFWAEWEAESEVTKIAESVPDGPKFIHVPYYNVPDSYCGHQNTDPFVFGSPFLYARCQQHKGDSETRLRRLDKGSVILFGSCRGQAFVLDTVFVVGDWIDYDADDFTTVLKQHVPQEFFDVTLAPLYGAGAACSKPSHPKGGCDESKPSQSWRLYLGATPDDPFDGMFSFFPCQPVVESPRGFARPRIAIPGVTSDTLHEGFKLACDLGIGQVQKHYCTVRNLVESAGLSLGVYAGMPKRRNATP